MIRFVIVLALLWMVVLPPFFTHGACTAEFDRVAADISAHKGSMASPAEALAYWQSKATPARSISAQQCRAARPRFVDECGAGDLIYVEVPVQILVCRIYRDPSIRVQLQYDAGGRVSRLITDMSGFKTLPVPGLGISLDWGR